MRNKTKLYQYIFRTTFISFCLIATLISITQSFNKVSAVESSSSATASVTVSSACSFSRTNEGDGNYAGTLANNSSVEVSGSTFTTFCNDPGGYAIYAIGYTNNEYGNTDLIYNNEPTSTYNIKTNPASSSDSNWKMKLSPVENDFAPTIENNYNNYSNIPSNYTKVASYNNVTMNDSDSTTGSSIATSYQATASSIQPAGTYTGAVKYTMVHPNTNIPDQPYTCPVNNLCYFPNAGNTVADTMGNIGLSSTSTSTLTLWASNFQRPGYGFTGWNAQFDGSGDQYGPNQTISVEVEQASSGVSLYAIWKESTGSMQNWTCPNNEDFPVGSVTALTDLRDNQTYAVAKLADGNCWMVENLRLNNGNVTANLSQGFGEGFIGLAAPETTNFSDSTTPNSLYDTGNSYTMPRFDNTNTTNPVANMTNVGQNVYSYGNYYTWAAAKASIDVSPSNSISICPSGWELPTGGNSGDFHNLNVLVNSGSTSSSAGLREYPNNFVYSGQGTTEKGTGFWYWSLSGSGNTAALTMRDASNAVNPGSGWAPRYFGATIRCLARTED